MVDSERVRMLRRTPFEQTAFCMFAVLAPLLVGCLDLDALRARAGGGADAGHADRETDAAGCRTLPSSCACSGDPNSLRFWKLQLGQADYLTLKNTGKCPIQLGGLQVFLDDRSELFPDYEVDCLVQLPAFLLPAGAEVRVHEKPLPGDISALDNKVSECGGGVSFNPERGGVSYLCDGACDAAHVIDVVAHTGDLAGPPEMRYGQTFDSPLAGVTVANQESAQYRRVASQGAAPDFRGADWQLETRYVYADFEKSVAAEVDGATTAWLPEAGQSATSSTSDVAAVGNVSLRLTHRGSDGRSDGLALAFGDGLTTPSHVSYFTRIDSSPAEGAYFDLQNQDFSVVQAGFTPTGLGTETDRHQRTDIVAAAGVFHQVEFRNFDWNAHTYDLYIDRVLVEADLRFGSNAFSVDRLSLYSVSSGSVVYWDEIELWH